MRVDWAQRPEYLAWAEVRLQQKFDQRTVTWLTSVSQTGSILGVVIFSRFTTGNCEVTVVGERSWLSRSLILASLGYVFYQMNLNRVTAFIAVGNDKSLSLAQRLGFRIEGVARRWYPTGDAHILGLLREDCPWLKDENGQPFPPATT